MSSDHGSPRVRCQRLAELWDEYAYGVLSDKCPEDLRPQIQDAFYKGAMAVVCGIAWELDTELEPTDDDMHIMADLYQELRDFTLEDVEPK